MNLKFNPNYMIRPVAGSEKVNLRVINPDDPNDYISILADDVEVACYKILEAYNASIGDPNFFYEWDDVVMFYDNEEASADESLWDEEWGQEYDYDNDEYLN